MKKFLRWIAIIFGAILIFLIIGIISLPFVFPLEKIKDFVIAKISETISREVRIEKVSFDIFSGIKLEKLYISNRTGFAKKPFVSADTLELRYAFWPLFSRKLIIKEIRLVRPEVLIEKNIHGEFNFSDLLRMKNEGRRTIDDTHIAADKRPAKPPFDLFITSFSIKDGKITYADYAAKTTSEIKNLNVKISGFELALVRPIAVSASANITYQEKEIPLSLSGKVEVNLEKETLIIPSFFLSIAGESASASAAVSNWKKAPQVEFSLSTKKLSVDPLLAVLATPTETKPKPKPGELTKTINRTLALIPKNIFLNGKVNLENLAFQKFKVDKVIFEVSLAGKKVNVNVKEIKIYEGILSGKLKADLNVPGIAYEAKELRLIGFNASPFSNAVVTTFLTKLPDYKDLVDKIYGTLDTSLSLKGRGVESTDILANLDASGSFVLKNGELKRLKTVDAIADKINAPALRQDLKISELSADFTFKKEVLDLRKLTLQNHDIGIKFSGSIDLNKLKFVEGNRLILKASPSATKDLAREFNLFRDEKGWLELTFELKGELKKPIPYPILEKPIEKAVEKLKVKIEAKKIEIEEAAKKKAEEERRRLEEEAKAKVEEEKKRLEEEAEKKVREMIKF